MNTPKMSEEYYSKFALEVKVEIAEAMGFDYVSPYEIADEATIVRSENGSIGHAKAIEIATEKLTGMPRSTYLEKLNKMLASDEFREESDVVVSPMFPTPRLDFSELERTTGAKLSEAMQPKNMYKRGKRYIKIASLMEYRVDKYQLGETSKITCHPDECEEYIKRPHKDSEWDSENFIKQATNFPVEKIIEGKIVNFSIDGMLLLLDEMDAKRFATLFKGSRNIRRSKEPKILLKGERGSATDEMKAILTMSDSELREKSGLDSDKLKALSAALCVKEEAPLLERLCCRLLVAEIVTSETMSRDVIDLYREFQAMEGIFAPDNVKKDTVVLFSKTFKDGMLKDVKSFKPNTPIEPFKGDITAWIMLEGAGSGVVDPEDWGSATEMKMSVVYAKSEADGTMKAVASAMYNYVTPSYQVGRGGSVDQSDPDLMKKSILSEKALDAIETRLLPMVGGYVGVERLKAKGPYIGHTASVVGAYLELTFLEQSKRYDFVGTTIRLDALFSMMCDAMIESGELAMMLGEPTIRENVVPTFAIQDKDSEIMGGYEPRAIDAFPVLETPMVLFFNSEYIRKIETIRQDVNEKRCITWNGNMGMIHAHYMELNNDVFRPWIAL